MNLFSKLRRWATVVAVVVVCACATPADAAAQGRVSVVEVIKYDQLGSRVGQQIVVRTTLGSRRSGTLVRYTKTALRLRLGARDGGVELDIPSSSVRDIEVSTESATTAAGADSAKKN